MHVSTSRVRSSCVKRPDRNIVHGFTMLARGMYRTKAEPAGELFVRLMLSHRAASIYDRSSDAQAVPLGGPLHEMSGSPSHVARSSAGFDMRRSEQNGASKVTHRVRVRGKQAPLRSRACQFCCRPIMHRVPRYATAHPAPAHTSTKHLLHVLQESIVHLAFPRGPHRTSLTGLSCWRRR